MVDAIDPLRHKDCFLLVRQCLCMVSHYIAKACQHAQTLRNFWMHCTINIVQQVQCFTDQFVAFLQVALLDFVLPSCIEVKSITCLLKKQYLEIQIDKDYIKNSFYIILFSNKKLLSLIKQYLNSSR